MDMLEKFLTFAEQSPTAFHAAANLTEMLKGAGYRELKETDPWLVDAGGKYYVVRNDAAVIAFAVPDTGFASFRIAAAHGDSPAFKLKEHFVCNSGCKLHIHLFLPKPYCFRSLVFCFVSVNMIA